jgi:glycerol-1-phosphate dehydrogenase [NAD(P)+]
LFTVQLPTSMKIEENLLEDLYKHISIFKLQKVLVVTGTGETSKYGTLVIEKNKNVLDDCIDHITINDNSIENVRYISDLIIQNEYTLLIGIGGGKVLDVCKYASHMCRIDFVCIPTTIAHDGIASPIAVIKFNDGVRSLGCEIPKAVLIDLDIILKSPDETKLAGIGDILSNITAIYDWKLSCNKNMDEINDFALLISDISVNSIINFQAKNLNDPLFLRELAISLVLSGLSMEIAGSSRPCSGSEHLFSHSLDLYFPNIRLPHGIKVAVGASISSYIQENRHLEIKEYLRKFGLPTSPKEAGIPDNIAIQALMLAKSTRKNRYTVLDEIELSETYFKHVLDKVNS